MKAPTQLRTGRGHLENMKLSTFNSTPRKGRFSSLTQTNEAQENFTKQIDLLLLSMYTIRHFFDHKPGISRRPFEQTSNLYAVNRGGQ